MSKVPSVKFIDGYGGGKRFSFSSAMVLTLVLLPVFIAPTRAQESQTILPSYTAVLTKDLKRKQPATQFHCQERLYLAFSWLGLKGKHQVTALWFNPLGKQQNQIDLEFLTDQPKVENWVALKFRDAPELANPFLPDFFSTKLNGEWQVKVLLDGNFLETLKFYVHCG